jgi:hypothetical protein
MTGGVDTEVGLPPVADAIELFAVSQCPGERVKVGIAVPQLPRCEQRRISAQNPQYIALFQKASRFFSSRDAVPETA